MKRLVLVCLVVFMGIFAAAAIAGTEPPLPNDVKIQPASPDILPQIANFLGIWEGIIKESGPTQFEKRRNVVIVVEKVTDKKVNVIYSEGQKEVQKKGGWQRTNMASEERYWRISGEIVDGKIIFKWDGRTVILTPSGNPKKIYAEMSLDSRKSCDITLYKREN